MSRLALYLLSLTVVAVGWLLGMTSPAGAGTLTHFSCQMPDGSPTNVASGWTTRERGTTHASAICERSGILVGLSRPRRTYERRSRQCDLHRAG